MNPWLDDGDVQLYHGDCIMVMADLPRESVSAIVCDPPYGLGFMGATWDTYSNETGRFQAWSEAWLSVAVHLLKPGGHLVAFGGTRTFHRLACAIEDAGFEMRDVLCWLYGSGFPKSLDVSKAIDKAAGVEREVIGKSDRHIGKYSAASASVYAQDAWTQANARMGEFVTAPATPDAERWQGWGTALKPAYEPIILARKPLVGTVAANVQAYGTGALNIDDCRVAGDVETRATPPIPRASVDNWRIKPGLGTTRPEGRWPANVVLDETAAALLDAQSGVMQTHAGTDDPRSRRPTGVTPFGGERANHVRSVEVGGASRFFYTAKASRGERNAGLGAMPEVERHAYDGGFREGMSDQRMDRAQERRPAANHHPTVKPLSLMRWLCRLVTPPGGVILDPFCGSGTTPLAARQEAHRCIAIDRELAYLEIAAARLSQQSLFNTSDEGAA